MEFQYSDLRFDTKIDPKEIVESIHSHIIHDIGLLESDIAGVHFLPNEKTFAFVFFFCLDIILSTLRCFYSSQNI